MSSDVSPRAASAPPALSRLGPFRHASFTALWIATIVSNIGGWMYSAASGWLMTSLSPDPFIVALVQVAASLPMFLLAIPAGALADIVDMRKLLLGTEIAIAVISGAFALIVWLDAATAGNLLLFTFLNGLVGALQAPPGRQSCRSSFPRRACRVRSRRTASASISADQSAQPWAV
jgi:MFS family permease